MIHPRSDDQTVLSPSSRSDSSSLLDDDLATLAVLSDQPVDHLVVDQAGASFLSTRLYQRVHVGMQRSRLPP
jgi:hypothetical protein